jgi:hypothetical protein
MLVEKKKFVNCPLAGDWAAPAVDVGFYRLGHDDMMMEGRLVSGLSRAGFIEGSVSSEARKAVDQGYFGNKSSPEAI